MTAAKKYDLSGQLALVTGAGRGIGRACARSLASAGAEVVFRNIAEVFRNVVTGVIYKDVEGTKLLQFLYGLHF